MEHERSDVWVFSSTGQVRRNLTQGKSDASGYWDPVWSPDGRRLAMLSSKGGENVHLYVWDRQRDRLELSTQQGVDQQVRLQLAQYERGLYDGVQGATFAHCRWLSDSTLIFAALPAGATGEWYHETTEPQRITERAWPLQERGTVSTASVLDAGPGAPPLSFAPLKLTLVNVRSHTSTALAPIPIGDYRHVPDYWPSVGAVSPDGHTLAIVVPVPISEWKGTSALYGEYIPGFRIAIIPLDRATSPSWVGVDSTGSLDAVVGGMESQIFNFGPARPVWATNGRSVVVHVQRNVPKDDRWYRISAHGDAVLTPIEATPSAIEGRKPLPLAVQARPDGRVDLVLHERDTVLTLNAGAEQIDRGRKIALRYLGMEGDSLTATLQLPVGYVAGRRYPMVTIVYDGSVQSAADTNPSLEDALWTGAGYLVLYPSMPFVGDRTQPGDNFIDLPKGVLPAVDKTIEMGYADPDRIGIEGCSYGGYSTYGIIEFTHRFKAAIAECAPSDLISEFGAFSTFRRYRDAATGDWIGGLPGGESGQTRMGGPPWENALRYARNNPINYVDRIDTPVMIVQGDMDFVSIQQGEEMFSSLARQGKRVEFVRYWGEGHAITSPANVRDVWRRRLAWFDTYLRAGEAEKR